MPLYWRSYLLLVTVTGYVSILVAMAVSNTGTSGFYWLLGWMLLHVQACSSLCSCLATLVIFLKLASADSL